MREKNMSGQSDNTEHLLGINEVDILEKLLRCWKSSDDAIGEILFEHPHSDEI
jgi:hypothetical protein